jgi:hypothetical protein
MCVGRGSPYETTVSSAAVNWKLIKSVRSRFLSGDGDLR